MGGHNGVMSQPIADLRREYMQAELLEDRVAVDPFEQFRLWFDQAVKTNPGEVFEANAMTLATIGLDGTPAARIVLLKELDDRGLVFFTNYRSAKGRELSRDPRAAAVFYWPWLERQVRIEGRCEQVSREESDAYFQTRPRESQLGAIVSQQSKPLPGREVLEAKMAQLRNEYEDKAIPTPESWGGYRLLPHRFEFWQGRRSRLHDRLLYTPDDARAGHWQITRLAP